MYYPMLDSMLARPRMTSTLTTTGSFIYPNNVTNTKLHEGRSNKHTHSDPQAAHRSKLAMIITLS